MIILALLILIIIFIAIPKLPPINRIRLYFTRYEIKRDQENYLTGLYVLTCEIIKRPLSTIQTCFQFIFNWYQLKYICKIGKSDLFYHAKANYNSKNKKAAEALSHFRENVMKVFRYDLKDRIITQEANIHGRNLSNPMKYYVKGIPLSHYIEFSKQL